jgi:hypothetical protein
MHTYGMNFDLNRDGLGGDLVGKWHTGVGTGIAGVIPIILFSVWQGNELFPLLGLVPFAVLWGVVYAGVNTIDRLEELASTPRTGALLGVVYSFLVWWGPQVGKPIGEYITVNNAIQVALFGIVLGVVYAYSPDVASGESSASNV